jgi:hypothetical protein
VRSSRALVPSASPLRSGPFVPRRGRRRPDGTVHVLIVKEQGVGAPRRPSPTSTSWSASPASSTAGPASRASSRRPARPPRSTSTASDPHYGIMSLGAFLALRGKHQLEVSARPRSSDGNGREYHIVSKTRRTSPAARARPWPATTPRTSKFVDKVIAGGAFALADFTLVATKRPVQTIKKVISGEAECALIDDAQFAELARVEGGAASSRCGSRTSCRRWSWSRSRRRPPPRATRAFKGKLGQICSGEGKAACGEVGIKASRPRCNSDYQAVVKAYGK